jgi:hypothetical protein
MKSSVFVVWGILGAAAFAASAAAVEPAPGGVGAWRGPEVAGRLPEAVTESSGLAASRRGAGLYWTHGDSGGEPVLTAIGADGALRGALRIAGVKNVDWEDLASFELDGKAWLLVADTGDNKAGRGECALLVVAEPDPAELDPAKELRARVAWRIPVLYPDGPRDVEAVAVDVREETVYLLAKRETPHGLYVLSLRPTPSGRPMQPMRRVGGLPAFPAAEGARALVPSPTGKYRPQPTGMDFSADGSAAVIVTYGDVLVYARGEGETWADALAKPGLALAPHGLAQAEAVAFGADREGRAELVVTSEGSGAKLLRYTRGAERVAR